MPLLELPKRTLERSCPPPSRRCTIVKSLVAFLHHQAKRTWNSQSCLPKTKVLLPAKNEQALPEELVTVNCKQPLQQPVHPNQGPKRFKIMLAARGCSSCSICSSLSFSSRLSGKSDAKFVTAAAYSCFLALFIGMSGRSPATFFTTVFSLFFICASTLLYCRAMTTAYG